MARHSTKRPIHKPSKLAACVWAQLAAARARNSPAHLRQVAWTALETRWWNLLSVAQQDALAASLVDDRLLTLDGHDIVEPTLVHVSR